MSRVTSVIAAAVLLLACGSGEVTLESLSTSFGDTASGSVAVEFTAAFGGLQTFSGTGTWDFDRDRGRFSVASPEFPASEIVTIGSATYRRSAASGAWEQEPAGRVLDRDGFLGSWSGSVPASAVDALDLIELAESLAESADGTISLVTAPTAQNDCRVAETDRCIRVEPITLTVEGGRVATMMVTVLLELPTDDGVQVEEAISWSIRYRPLEDPVDLPVDLPER